MESPERTQLAHQAVHFAQQWVDQARRLAYGYTEELPGGASVDALTDALGSAAMKLQVAYQELTVGLDAASASGQSAGGESPA